jgi:glycyl-tRNA synthetase beta chain
VKFLLEIGVEEIPDWMLVPAIGHLRTQIETLVGRTAEWAEATPRRLAVLVDGVAAREADQVQLVKGPPIAAAPQAVAGFAKKQGVTVEEMTQASGYWQIEKKIAGRDTAAVLSEKLPQLILGIPWPKTMLWPGKGGERFIRPIRWLVALLDETVVPFAINGVASANKTSGHRMMGANNLAVTPETYESVLRENGVILRAADRRKKLLGEVGQDTPLIDLHVYLNEFPTAIRGSFDPAYLTLPEEVLVTVMRYHQKYFAVHDASGKLAPEFIAVMNRDGDPEGLIRHGHERVLRARFNDARFFYDVDQKKPLRDRLADLESVTFQAQLGNYRQKADRMVALCDDDASKRAALLSKCDLTTDMVKEFTELQGIIGGRYAEAQGEPAEVARAIYDHYKPLSMEDAIPATRTGQIVALADKVDTLREFFRIGVIPSGSKDPFALRRAAQGERILSRREGLLL